MAKGAYYYAIGRRKTARATVRLYPSGKGDMTVNGVPLRQWADTRGHQLLSQQALEVLGRKADYDVEVRVSGGGKMAQADSIRLGIARALYKSDQTLKPQLKAESLLTRDPRSKERKKPGLKRARRAPQFSKR
ncbi:30S ribosomal protein S9 [Candidatus Peribacteria bacterium]|nr:30S ribosomal protein S9 [Candidatus Peribacteria bacterium]